MRLTNTHLAGTFEGMDRGLAAFTTSAMNKQQADVLLTLLCVPGQSPAAAAAVCMILGSGHATQRLHDRMAVASCPVTLILPMRIFFCALPGLCSSMHSKQGLSHLIRSTTLAGLGLPRASTAMDTPSDICHMWLCGNHLRRVGQCRSCNDQGFPGTAQGGLQEPAGPYGNC